jgi:hypothetical protein
VLSPLLWIGFPFDGSSEGAAVVAEGVKKVDFIRRRFKNPGKVSTTQVKVSGKCRYTSRIKILSEIKT